MFFVARSVFWLTAAYLVIKPGIDLPDPGEMSAKALSAGSKVVSEQVVRIECGDLQCMGGKLVVNAALAAVVPSGGSAVPLPRSRPATVN